MSETYSNMQSVDTELISTINESVLLAANQDVLNKLGDSNGSLTYDGKAVGGRQTATVTLDDGGLKLNAFELGNMECNITGSRRKVAVIMTGTIALAVAGALITLGVDELVGFMLQKGIESLFNTALDEIFQFALYGSFI